LKHGSTVITLLDSLAQIYVNYDFARRTLRERIDVLEIITVMPRSGF
jgi:hypothetical protein